MALKKTHKISFWLITLIGLLFSTGQVVFYSAAADSSSLVINELMAANGTGLRDEDNDDSDWIEIYNRGQTAINLSGWALTDDPNRPAKWVFPDITLAGRAYLIVFASGKDRRPVTGGGELHTNFKLHRAGEFLGLYNILERRFKDVISPHFSRQVRDKSYGLYGEDGNYGYFAKPTPGRPNTEATVWLGLVSGVEFDKKRAFYETPFVVTLSTATPGTTIHYTTDGSEPGELDGLVYTDPIHINTTTTLRAIAFKPNFLPSEVDTQSYIFLDEVIEQPASPAGFPATWGRYSKDSMGHKKGSPVVADYEMSPDIVYDPRYKDQLKEALQSIPTMSVVLDRQSFTELYSNPMERGSLWERPASVEFFDPARDGAGFQINAGLRIQGNLNREEIAMKHSFRLFFRGNYGPARLDYPLFPDSPVREFETIILRGGGTESYTNRALALAAGWMITYCRDEWLRHSQSVMSGFGSHGLFVHLYINGLYWGLYNVIEKPDESFLAAYFGGQKEEWQVKAPPASFHEPGDRVGALYAFVNQGGLEAPERYESVKQYLDTAQFIDYLILNWYAGNKDWPHHNWLIGSRYRGGQLKYLVWDGEVTWIEGAEIYFGEGEQNVVTELFYRLIQNPDFRLELADRLYKHLFNDGTLTDANAQARWLQITQVIDRAIMGESARWGDTGAAPSITRDDWLRGRDYVSELMNGNGAKLIDLARRAGYYPDIDPPTFSQHGGPVPPGFNLSLIYPGQANGIIYYTTNGADPRAPVTGLPAPDAIVYNTPLILTTTTHIKARLWVGDQAHSTGSRQAWSALNEATFRVVEQETNLRITEIMYNPLGGNDYEFVELSNLGDRELPPANISFDEGIWYTFPPNIPPLAPGDSVVLVRNLEAFTARYPGIPVIGVYDGQLSNEGEKITLKDGAGNIILSVSYDDENDWPISPDGRGDSLIMIDANGDPNDPKNWRASPRLNGSPGLIDIK